MTGAFRSGEKNRKQESAAWLKNTHIMSLGLGIVRSAVV